MGLGAAFFPHSLRRARAAQGGSRDRAPDRHAARARRLSHPFAGPDPLGVLGVLGGCLETLSELPLEALASLASLAVALKPCPSWPSKPWRPWRPWRLPWSLGGCLGVLAVAQNEAGRRERRPVSIA